MVFNVLSSTYIGTESQLVTVETTIQNSLPCIKIVGLPNKAVEDAKERVLPAIKSAGVTLKPQRITVNLAPSDIPKRGSSMDLPIALSIIGSYNKLPQSFFKDKLFIGELGLDGSIRKTTGVFQAIDLLKSSNYKYLVLPLENKRDLKVIRNFDDRIILVQSLNEILQWTHRTKTILPYKSNTSVVTTKHIPQYYNLIATNEHIKRTITIAVAGRHHLLMIGPPGTGKTLTAKVLPELSPKLSSNEVYNLAKVYSIIYKNLPIEIINRNTPFRSPHHTASYTSIIGGGTFPVPGEISLAHKGILFLDEFPEFSLKTINALREPLEEKQITITRTRQRVIFPCDFQLVAALNPCPCGYYNDPDHKCTCTNQQIKHYQNKISPIILDRIDLSTYLRRPKIHDLYKDPINDFMNVRAKIQRTRNIQKFRFRNTTIKLNCEMSLEQIKAYCKFTLKSQQLLDDAYYKLSLSPRSYIKIIRVAQTIADLEKSSKIKSRHVIESLRYRISEQ